MELRHIRYFLAVVEELNFTRAAEKLGISQPPLSQQIHGLEAEIGVPLFHRGRQGVELTEAGEAFLEKVWTFPSQTESAKRAARRAARGETGSLRVSFTGSTTFNSDVPRLIRTFRHHYPEIELFLRESNTMQQLEMLEKNDVDLAFIRPGLRDPDGLKLVRFEDEPMLMVVPSVHPLAGRISAPLSDMQDEPFVLFPRSAECCLYEEVVRCCVQSGFEPHLTQEAPHMVSVINLVAAEIGVSIVPWSMTQVMKVLGVAYVPISGLAPQARMALASRRGRISIAARNFISLAIEGLHAGRVDGKLQGGRRFGRPDLAGATISV